MKRPCLLYSMILLLNTVAAQPPWENGKLAIAANKTMLQHENGKPFFWQADIAWLLLQRMSRDDIKLYFENRKAKGFNVVQCTFLQFYSDKNFYGDSAYLNKDIASPSQTPGANPLNQEEYDFWDHADYAADVAEQNGIYLAIVPIWGQLVKRDDQITKEKIEKFGTFLAQHFKKRANIIWLNGGAIQGDIKPDLWQALGNAIKIADPDHLMSFHPFGRTQSSTWFNKESWLDFNMYVSGHKNYAQDTAGKKYGEDNWRYVIEDLEKQPLKPTIDGESSFESTPQGLHDHSQPYWGAADVRRYAYWSVFAGAAGHTYGQNSVRQVYKQGINKPESGAKLSFTDALNDTGSFQIQYLQKLVLSRPYFERVNDQSLVTNNGERYSRVMLCKGRSYLFAYTCNGRSFSVKMKTITGKKVQAWWYNPKNGIAANAGIFNNTGVINFNPPGEPADGNDWVLVLDDVSKQYKIPGQ